MRFGGGGGWMGARSQADACCGALLVLGDLRGLPAPLQKMLEQLGDVYISLWKCSPCAWCHGVGYPPPPPSPLCFFAYAGAAANASGSFSPAEVQEVWENGGGVHHQLSHCKGVPLQKKVKCIYVPSVASHGAPEELVQLSVGLSFSALPQATAGFFLVLHLYCSRITGLLCRISSK